jgi:hypothetical protein
MRPRMVLLNLLIPVKAASRAAYFERKVGQSARVIMTSGVPDGLVWGADIGVRSSGRVDPPVWIGFSLARARGLFFGDC